MIKLRIWTSVFRRLGARNSWETILRKEATATPCKLLRRAYSKSGYTPPKAAIFPERLLVYHAGTLRTVFVGCLKINTIFLFSFSCLVIAPSFYLSPDWSNWILLGVIIGGAIPMVFVTYTTAPFVSYVHIKLPAFARRSKEQLVKWIEQVPANTEIDLTTMRFSGRVRVCRMLLSDLKETKARLGVANLARASNSTVSKSRPWWMGREPDCFYVANDIVKGRKFVWKSAAWQKDLWQFVLGRIKSQS